MVSFGFSDGEHIVFSLGIRPERGEAYSSVAGFFKSCELILTGADERDAVGCEASLEGVRCGSGARVPARHLRYGRPCLGRRHA